MFMTPRLARELKTITAMVKIYCRKNHNCPKGTVCQSCADFLEYAQKRLARCPFKEQKPACGNCTIHCYKKEMQARARKIMRYAGPRMIWHHPSMALYHLLDGRKKVPDLRSYRPTDDKPHNK